MASNLTPKIFQWEPPLVGQIRGDSCREKNNVMAPVMHNCCWPKITNGLFEPMPSFKRSSHVMMTLKYSSKKWHMNRHLGIQSWASKVRANNIVLQAFIVSLAALARCNSIRGVPRPSRQFNGLSPKHPLGIMPCLNFWFLGPQQATMKDQRRLTAPALTSSHQSWRESGSRKTYPELLCINGSAPRAGWNRHSEKWFSKHVKIREHAKGGRALCFCLPSTF